MKEIEIGDVVQHQSASEGSDFYIVIKEIIKGNNSLGVLLPEEEWLYAGEFYNPTTGFFVTQYFSRIVLYKR